MDKHKLITEFYSTIDKTSLKLETTKGGFDYLSKLSNVGTLLYSEWKNSVFKYKLTDIEKKEFDKLIDLHINGEINYCAYLDSEKNNIFCFNLDSFDDDLSNLKVVTIYLVENLLRINIEPIILKSGHGYHIWVRLCDKYENSVIQNFMENMMDVAVFQAVVKGVSIKGLQCIFYPRVNKGDISIRLFGTYHSVTQKFVAVTVRIDKEDTVLSEEESWQYFEEFFDRAKVKSETFDFAIKTAERLAKTVK